MRQNKEKKISLFMLIISFLIISSLSVFLINTIITVNNLIQGVSSVKEELSLATEINNTLKIEIEKLSSFDRIRKLAEDRIGLKLNENSFVNDKYFKIQSKED